jgi:hypothetical protein
MSAFLCALQKQKSDNVIVIVFDSHEVNFNDVVNCVQTDLKNMNRDCFLEINEQKIFV